MTAFINSDSSSHLRFASVGKAPQFILPQGIGLRKDVLGVDASETQVLAIVQGGNQRAARFQNRQAMGERLAATDAVKNQGHSGGRRGFHGLAHTPVAVVVNRKIGTYTRREVSCD